MSTPADPPPPDDPPPAEDRPPGIVSGGLRVGTRAGRLARDTVRLAGKAPVVGPALQRAGEAAAGEVRETPERLVDLALASALTDAVGRMLAEHRVVERLAARTIETADVEAAVAKALEDDGLAERFVEAVVASGAFERIAADVTSRILASPELDRVIERVAASPALRAALAEQGSDLASETMGAVRTRAASLDDRIERTARRWFRRRQRAEAT